jgi:hypothetical protein
MLSEKWEDQYRRLHRSYERLKRAVDEYIDRDEEVHKEENSCDILYHFCADAYHLKDYIKNSTGQSQATMHAVELLFDVQKDPHASTALAICADIANGFKHLNLHRSRLSADPAKAAKVTKQEAGITFPKTFPAYFTYHFTIEADGVTYNELDIANQAIADWDAWLTGHGFSLPT